MNQKLIKAIPYILILIALAFTLYSTSELQKSENKCNTHLKEQYDSFKDNSCKICVGEETPLKMLNMEDY